MDSVKCMANFGIGQTGGREQRLLHGSDKRARCRIGEESGIRCEIECKGDTSKAGEEVRKGSEKHTARVILAYKKALQAQQYTMLSHCINICRLREGPGIGDDICGTPCYQLPRHLALLKTISVSVQYATVILQIQKALSYIWTPTSICSSQASSENTAYDSRPDFGTATPCTPDTAPPPSPPSTCAPSTAADSNARPSSDPSS